MGRIRNSWATTGIFQCELISFSPPQKRSKFLEKLGYMTAFNLNRILDQMCRREINPTFLFLEYILFGQQSNPYSKWRHIFRSQTCLVYHACMANTMTSQYGPLIFTPPSSQSTPSDLTSRHPQAFCCHHCSLLCARLSVSILSSWQQSRNSLRNTFTLWIWLMAREQCSHLECNKQMQLFPEIFNSSSSYGGKQTNKVKLTSSRESEKKTPTWTILLQADIAWANKSCCIVIIILPPCSAVVTSGLVMRCLLQLWTDPFSTLTLWTLHRTAWLDLWQAFI